MAATTPIGSRVTSESASGPGRARPRRRPCRSTRRTTGRSWPPRARRRASVSRIGLPTSSASSRASSSRCSRMSSARRSMTALALLGRLIGPAAVVEGAPRRSGPRDRRPRRRPRPTCAMAEPSRPAMSVVRRARRRPARRRPSMNRSRRRVDGGRARDPVGGRPGGGGGRGHAAYLVMAASSRTAPMPGRGGHAEQPIGVGADGLGQEGVAALGGPAGRVVRELEERPAADTGRHVQVGEQADAVGPGVRREPAVAGERELADRPRREASRPPGPTSGW